MYVPNPPYHETINKLLYEILQYFKGNSVPMNVPKPPFYNTTNDLLYAILQSLNSGGQTVYSQFRILYVSARYGNDSTAQPNNDKLPYRTITAAKNNSFAGDIIHVMEGIYDEGNLFGSYTYWFDYGAQVVFTQDGSIFQNAPGQCVVRGHGVFKTTSFNGFVVNVGNWTFATLDMECESMESLQNTINLWQNVQIGDPLYKPHRIRAKKVSASIGWYCVGFRFGSHGVVEIEEIHNSTDGGAIFIGNMNKGFIRNTKLTGTNYPALHFGGAAIYLLMENCEINTEFDDPVLGAGIISNGGIEQFYLYNTRINCTNPNANCILNLISPLALYLDNNVKSNRDTGVNVPINYMVAGTKIILDNSNGSMDITGLTSIDLSAFQNAEVIQLTSSNPAETITEINNAPKHHSIKLLPASGLTLTLQSGDPRGASDSSIILESASLQLNGTNGDWIELRNGLYGTGNRQVTASNYPING